MDITKLSNPNRLRHSKSFKSKYSTPKKGTKRRTMINLLLRPEGLSLYEIEKLGFSKLNFSKDIEWMRSDCGFDVLIVGRRPLENSHRFTNVYRIIGRYYWDGRYRSFLKS